jgi:adenosylhomocysteinase
MDGHRVMKMIDAAPLGDVFVTATGCNDVITREHFEVMKNNAILANAGHFDCEISKPDLESLAVRIEEERKPFIRGYYMADGRVLNLMADGRLVNIVAGNGHPAEIMDLSFSIQALTLEYAAKNKGKLNVDLYDVPAQIDSEVARLKLEAMQLGMDKLTPEQSEYFFGTGD